MELSDQHVWLDGGVRKIAGWFYVGWFVHSPAQEVCASARVWSSAKLAEVLNVADDVAITGADTSARSPSQSVRLSFH